VLFPNDMSPNEEQKYRRRIVRHKQRSAFDMDTRFAVGLLELALSVLGAYTVVRGVKMGRHMVKGVGISRDSEPRTFALTTVIFAFVSLFFFTDGLRGIWPNMHL